MRAHTRLTVRAAEWEANNNDESLLLRGTDLTEAEQWQINSLDKEPLPTRDQINFIKSSREAANKRQRRLLIAVVGGLLLMTILAIFAWSQRELAHTWYNRGLLNRPQLKKCLPK